jgi:hypothetical protein
MASSSTRYTEHELDRTQTRFAINCRLVSRSLLNHPMIYNRWPCKLKAQLGGSSTKLRPILVLVFLDLRNTFILAVMWAIWEAEVGLFWSFESNVPGYSVSVSVKWERNIISLSDWRLIMQSIDYELYELSVSLRQNIMHMMQTCSMFVIRQQLFL